MEDVDGPGAEEVVREAPDAEDGLGEVGGAGGELLRVFFFFFFSGFSFPSSGVSRQRRFCVSSSSPPLLFGFSLRILFPRKRYDAPRQQRLGRSRRPAGPRRGRGGEGAGGSSFFFFWLSSLMGVRFGGKTKSELQTLETLFLLFTFLFGSLTSSPHLLCPSPPRLNRPSPRSSRWSERSPCSSRPRTRSKEPPKEGGRPTLVRYSDRERLLAINETV